MTETGTRQPNYRILVVDDNPSIHEDFKKILPARQEEENTLNDLLLEFLDEEDSDKRPSYEPEYIIDHAYQGEEAFRLVSEAEDSGNPYALLFVDVRMPPGWDGIETIRRIWEKYPHNEVVICTAYSDYSWEEILEKLGTSDQLQFLRKPFDVVSIKQMALALTKKWNLARKSRQYTEDLENEVQARTKELRLKIEELEKAMSEIKALQGILPMCAWCHKVRNDDNYWQQVDDYLSSHSIAEISHGICPECYDKMMNQLDERGSEKDKAAAPTGETGNDDVGSKAIPGRFSLLDLKNDDEDNADEDNDQESSTGG